LYLIIVTVCIYATFGYNSFQDQFTVEDDAFYGAVVDDDEVLDEVSADEMCTSVSTCFWYIMYAGVPAGDISGLLAENSFAELGDTFYSRFIFDLSFFIWVGILLFNIITGIMLDTFAALREEAESREDIMSNECFICGLKRDAYDDLNLPPGSPSFDDHCENEHNIWNYMFFINYVREKDPNFLDGIESYVMEQLDQPVPSLLWIPSRSSYTIQASKKEQETDNIQELTLKVERLTELVATLGGQGPSYGD